MGVQECVDDIRKLVGDVNGDNIPMIRARIDRFANEMRSGGKDELRNLMEALERAARRVVPTVASDYFESAARYADKIRSGWG